MALFFKNEDHIEETFAKHIMRKAKTSSTCYVHYVRAFVFKRPTARTRTRVLATRSSSGFKVFARGGGSLPVDSHPAIPRSNFCPAGAGLRGVN